MKSALVDTGAWIALFSQSDEHAERAAAHYGELAGAGARLVERDAWRILEQAADVKLSLTDATTVAVARRRKIGEIFGFDRGFEALGLLVAPLR